MIKRKMPPLETRKLGNDLVVPSRILFEEAKRAKRVISPSSTGKRIIDAIKDKHGNIRPGYEHLGNTEIAARYLRGEKEDTIERQLGLNVRRLLNSFIHGKGNGSKDWKMLQLNESKRLKDPKVVESWASKLERSQGNLNYSQSESNFILEYKPELERIGVNTWIADQLAKSIYQNHKTR